MVKCGGDRLGKGSATHTAVSTTCDDKDASGSETTRKQDPFTERGSIVREREARLLTAREEFEDESVSKLPMRSTGFLFTTTNESFLRFSSSYEGRAVSKKGKI